MGDFVVRAVLVALFVVSFVSWCLGSNRFPRRTGDQVPDGKCQAFIGGLSKVHWYACCNNCNDTDTSCDGITYQSASTSNYCDNCGVDGVSGNGFDRDVYGCNGCVGQNTVNQNCTSSLGRFHDVLGTCWVFAWCFEWKCLRQATLRDAEEGEDTCFDLVCNNGETVESCPIDCCGTVNEMCDWSRYNGTTDECPDICCSKSTCCNSSGTGKLGAQTPTLLMTIAFVVVKMSFVVALV